MKMCNAMVADHQSETCRKPDRKLAWAGFEECFKQLGMRMQSKNEFSLGSPGKGKSIAIPEDHQGEIGRSFVLVLDREGSTARAFLDRCRQRDYRRVLVDDLDDMAAVVPIEGLKCVGSATEQKRARNAFMDYLNRGQLGDLSSQLTKRRILDVVLKVFQHLPEKMQVPGMLPELLVQNSSFATAAFECLPFALRDELSSWHTLHPATFLKEVASYALPLLEPLSSPAVACRFQPITYDLAAGIKRRWIVVIRGGDREEFKLVAGYWLSSLYRMAEKNAGRMMIIIDEALNDGMVGQEELYALNKYRKHDTHFSLASQYLPSFDTEEDQEAFLNAFPILKVYGCVEARTAQWAAGRMGALVDPNKARATETRTETIGHRWEEIESESISADGRKTISRRPQLIPQTAEREIKIYDSRQDQLFDIACDIQQLGPGERYVVNHGKITREKTQLPRRMNIWSESADDRELTRWIKKKLPRDMHLAPLFIEDVEKQLWSGSLHTRQPQDSSSPLDSLKAKTARKGRRGGGGKKDR